LPSVSGEESSYSKLFCNNSRYLNKVNIISTMHQDWNGYFVDHGRRVRIQPLMRVARTSLFDNKSEPIYWADVQGNVNVTPPNPAT
jgi:hypothetical protein